MYSKLGNEYLKSDIFWTLYKVSYPQANYDKEYLYGILVSATRNQKHKTILKHNLSKDGIFAWYEFLQDFDHEGSDDIRLQKLEHMLQKPYDKENVEDLADNIDKFGTIIAELEANLPKKYTNRGQSDVQGNIHVSYLPSPTQGNYITTCP